MENFEKMLEQLAKSLGMATEQLIKWYAAKAYADGVADMTIAGFWFIVGLALFIGARVSYNYGRRNGVELDRLEAMVEEEKPVLAASIKAAKDEHEGGYIGAAVLSLLGTLIIAGGLAYFRTGLIGMIAPEANGLNEIIHTIRRN